MQNPRCSRDKSIIAAQASAGRDRLLSAQFLGKSAVAPQRPRRRNPEAQNPPYDPTFLTRPRVDSTRKGGDPAASRGGRDIGLPGSFGEWRRKGSWRWVVGPKLLLIRNSKGKDGRGRYPLGNLGPATRTPAWGGLAPASSAALRSRASRRSFSRRPSEPLTLRGFAEVPCFCTRGASTRRRPLPRLWTMGSPPRVTTTSQ